MTFFRLLNNKINNDTIIMEKDVKRKNYGK